MKRRGFTLIELLVVMAIMGIMAGIGVASYFELIRGTAVRSAVSHLSDTLSLARQMAVMNGKRVYVVFGREPKDAGQPEKPAWYAVCRHEGTGAGASGGRVLRDRFGYFEEEIVGARIYNVSSPGNVRWSAIEEVPATGDQLKTEESIWRNGDNKYGWEINPRTYLPKGIQFGDGTDSDLPSAVVFNADGTTRLNGYRIDVVEKIHESGASGIRNRRVTVAGLTGLVSVQWE